MNAAQPKRVAIVTRPATGGMRTHVEALITGFDRARYVPTLFAPSDFEDFRNLPDLARVNVAIGGSSNPAKDLRAIRSVASRLRSFDLVHAHGLRGALVGVLAASRVGVPSLFTAHNLVRPAGLLGSLFFRAVGSRASAVIAVSNAVADTLVNAGVDRSRIHVIPNGVDLSEFANLPERDAARAEFGVEPDAPLAVAIGRLSPEKGFDLAIDAFRAVAERARDARLLIAGVGAEEQRLRALASNVAGVSLIGRVESVAKLLAAADVVIVPSREEGQGLTALEGMAASRPVIATNVGGLPETIVDGETGTLVAAESPTALTHAIIAIIEDKRLAQAMGVAGRTRVEREFDVRDAVGRVEKLYDTILAS